MHLFSLVATPVLRYASRWSVLCTYLFLAMATCAQAAVLSTLAGGNIGDGLVATMAFVPSPMGVAVDANGNAYIADTYSQRIRKVAADGTIGTVAGGGTGALGDGGLAVAASLSGPVAVAVDGSGKLYISDSGNQRIRTVTTDGIITTLAGDGTQGYGGDGGAAAYAHLANPQGLAVDGSGNVYIADRDNHCIRKVDAGGIITAFAGTCGSPGSDGDGGAATKALLQSPAGVAVDAAGSVYIADTGNHRIRVVGSNGVIHAFAGTGSAGYGGDAGAAAAAMLDLPQGVFLDGTGVVYIADTGNQVVRSVALDGTISTVVGTQASVGGFGGDGGNAVGSLLNAPVGGAVDAAGNLYIADRDNGRIRKVSGGSIATFAGGGSLGDGGVATDASLFFPAGVAVAAQGNVYIAERWGHRLRRVAPDGTLTTIAGDGQAGYTGDGAAAASARLNAPSGVMIDSNGVIYIADTGNNVVRKIGTDGNISTFAGMGPAGWANDGGLATKALLHGPTGLAIDTAGNVYIADSGNHLIRKVSAGKGIITTAAGRSLPGYTGDGGQATVARLTSPSAVAVGAGGVFYIADSGNHAIRKVAANGIISTVAGNGTPGFGGDGGPATAALLDMPMGVMLDAGGNLYVADSFNSRLRRIDTKGNIVTVAGSGNGGFAGDGGAATSGEFYRPQGIAINSGGDSIYLADSGNARVRKLALAVNAQLAALGLNTGHLAPEFDPAVASYAVSVPNGTARITITPIAADTGASVSINGTALPSSGTASVAVADGAAINIDVVAENRSTTLRYTLAVSVRASGATAPPDSPGIVRASPGDGGATVVLSPSVSDGGEPITGYTVSSNPAGGVDLDAGTTRLVHTLTGLVDGTAYTFTAVATNAAGDSDPSLPSASVQIGADLKLSSNQTGTLGNRSNVDLSAGSTLDVAAGTAAAGSVLNLPQADATVNLGGQNAIVSAQLGGAQLGLGLAAVNGQQVLLLQLLSGSASLTLPAGAPMLMVGNTAVSAGTAGARVIMTLASDDTIDIIVVSGSLTVPCGSLCASSQASRAVHTASIVGPVTALAGERLHYDRFGVLQAWTLSITGGGAGSVLAATGLPANVSLAAPLYSLDGNLARLNGGSLQAAVVSTVSSVLGVSLQAQPVNAVGCTYWSAPGVAIYAAPQGPIGIDPSQATGLSLLADGKVQVVESGIVVQLAPCMADLVSLANALGNAAQLTVDGLLLRAALGDTHFVIMPAWLTSKAAGSGFGADASGNLTYTGATGTKQGLYPAFSNYAQLAAVLKAFDPASTALVNLDGTVSVTLAKTHMTFLPSYQTVPTPTAHIADAWWLDGSVLYLNDQDGSAQAFSVR